MSKREFQKEGRIREKNTWSRIEAYSYLNPRGNTYHALESFEEANDVQFDLKKICTWIGKIRKKVSQLSDLHENELFDWLYRNDGYGNRMGQVSRYDDFEHTVLAHIFRLEQEDIFHAHKPINILKLKRLPPGMQEYYRLVKHLRVKKRKVMKDFHSKRRALNRDVVKKHQLL